MAFTEEQIEQMRELVDSSIDDLYWVQQDGTKIKMIEASEEDLLKWKNHCESMLYSKNANKPGKTIIYNNIENQKKLINAELFIRYLTSNSALQTSKYDLGNHIITFIANNNHVDNIEHQSIQLMFNGLDPKFNSVKICDARDACLNQLGVFKKYFTAKFIYSCGVWITAKDDKELNLPKKADSNEKLMIIKERCNIRPEVRLKLNPKGLSLAEFRTALNMKNKNYSSLSTNELQLLRNKLLNNYQFRLIKQIRTWERLLADINKVLEFKSNENNEE